MGLENFKAMMKIGWDINVGSDFPSWLIEFKRLEKNSKQREDYAEMKQEVERIENIPEKDRTEEENDLLDYVEEKRLERNRKKREDCAEMEQEVERIMSKPKADRTKEENDLLADAEEKRLERNRK